jgi:hypothetical protein
MLQGKPLPFPRYVAPTSHTAEHFKTSSIYTALLRTFAENTYKYDLQTHLILTAAEFLYIGFQKDTITSKMKLLTHREPNIIKQVSVIIENHSPTEIHTIINKRIANGSNMIISCLDRKGPMPAIWPL